MDIYQCDADNTGYNEYNDILLERRSFKPFIIMHVYGINKCICCLLSFTQLLLMQ